MTDAAAVEQLCEGLAAHGIRHFGGFTIEASEVSADADVDLAGAPALLFGNAGPAMWEQFAASPEYGDGESDPMDRWTRCCARW